MNFSNNREEKRELQRQIAELKDRVAQLEKKENELNRTIDILRKSRLRFKKMADNIQAGVIIIENGKPVYANKRACEILGYPRKELMRMTGIDLAIPEDKQKLLELWKKVKEGGISPRKISFWISRKDGTKRFVVNHYSIDEVKGQAVFRYVIIHDMTANKIAEQALQDRKSLLEEMVEERTEELKSFVYSVSHELQAPLRALRGFCYFLMEEHADRLTEEGQQLVRKIDRSGKWMGELIKDLLSYSRVSHTEINLKPVNLEQITDKAIKQTEENYDWRNPEITVKSPLHEVIGHNGLIERILVNLLSNAVKFVPEGAIPRVEIWSEQKDRQIRVNIRDNGIGFDEVYADKIFKIFHRLELSESYSGTGIGLAIVKKCMEKIKGRLGVESKKGKGSVFWFELPAADQEALNELMEYYRARYNREI